MRTTAAIAAGTIVLAAAPFASAEEPLEQLLIDVTASHNSHSETLEAQQEDIDAAEESGDDEALVEAQDAYRATLKEWRTDLIDASDDLRELRADAEQEAEESGTPLSKEDKEAFTEVADAIKEDRQTVRELRTEVLGDDEAVCLPGLIAGDTGLGGLLGTTAMDAVERSEQGDKRIAFDCAPESTHATTEVKRAEEPTAVAGSTEASTSVSAEPEATEATEEPNVRYRANVLADSDEEDDETTSSSTSSESSTTSTTATETSSSTSSPAETTTGTASSTTSSSSSTSESTSATAILHNRTTSASSSTKSSTTTRTTSSTRSSSTTTEEDEREGDLAETGTPMLNLIVLALLLTAGGVFLVRRPA
ncbi:hypothetical protein FPH17_11670 [Corynebacterium godavarianum]|uniref:LPXTG cell wall anchor domain-containing protein n=1 Tax=Corynebacterium godavarianum TaxID=2054421 RepID=A0ABY3DXT2_9CORY|nr:hypothetical protein [Corynebacterium godavarianum]MBL7286703.1 hypothetical protein [Corynebacterium godavarianum]TSJ70360.1 hypothetical protein FPH17_11670 [Corynebacterium godavarianum]